MGITFILIILTSIIALCCSIYGIHECNRALRRNNEVYTFRTLLLELTSNYARRHILEGDSSAMEVYDWFFDKYSHDDMMKSKKPLILEEWFTKEELEKIKS